MTDTLKKNFENFRNSDYKEFLDKLEETFSEFGIDFYLIGATSRDLWIKGISSISDARATFDLDFAIYINDNHEYEAIKSSLGSKGFDRTSHAYRMTYGNIIIDLIPFGQIEVNRTVELVDPIETISVLGFEEVFGHSIEAAEGFKVATLYGLCVLKLISFSDRPDRVKDIEDFEYIIKNYFEINQKEIFDKYTDIIDELKEMEIVGSKVLAYQMLDILDSNTDLKAKVLDVLTKRLPKFSYSEIDEMYENDKNDDQIQKFKLILEVIREFEK